MRKFSFGKSYFSTLVLAKSSNNKISKNTLKVLNAAKQLNQPISVLVVSDNTEALVENLRSIVKSDQVSQIISVDHKFFQNPQADTYSLIEKYSFKNIVGSTSSLMKDVIPRVAATYGVQAITDIIEIKSNNQFKRPVYAGNAISTVESQDEIKFMTFRPTNFDEIVFTGGPSKVEKFNVKLDKQVIHHIKNELQTTDKPELTSAKIVVAGGRGIQSKENFKILDQLADVLGNAAVGASRAAVDAGYIPNDFQIGQTGKVVAPDLYFAIGISGAIQHLSGMKDSKVIVAINKDPEASIIQVANYSLIGDLFKIVPELTEKLKASK